MSKKYYRFGVIYEKDHKTIDTGYDEYIVNMMAKYNLVQQMFSMIESIMFTFDENKNKVRVFDIPMKSIKNVHFKDKMVNMEAMELLRTIIYNSFKDAVNDEESTDVDKVQYIANVSSGLLHYIESDIPPDHVILYLEDFKEAFENITGQKVPETDYDEEGEIE